MHRYIIKRLILVIPILLGATFIVFTILALTPGDPARLILGSTASEETVNELREEMGLNKPVIVRYVTYVSDAVRGDFGDSYTSRTPVFSEILKKFPVTLKIAAFAMILTVLVGVPLGIFSALRHRKALDVSITVVSMVMMGIPGFWLALILMLIFSLSLSLLPTNGIGTFAHYILPVVTLSIGTIASLTRVVRTTMLDTIKQDYITTARAKGAPEKVVILRHALKNAMLIIVTQVGLTFTALLAGSVLIEQIFGLPGLGSLSLTAIRGKDIPMVMATTIFLTIISTTMILLLDILYAYIDPRIKAKYIKGESS